MQKLLPALILFIFLMNYFPANKPQAYSLSHPPLPAESSQARKIAIVTLSRSQEPQNILAKFPELKLRYVFKYALDGFSVEGPAQSLQALSKHADIINVSTVSSYKVEDVPLHTIQPITPIKEIKINPGTKSDKTDEDEAGQQEDAGQTEEPHQPSNPGKPGESGQPSEFNPTTPAKESQSNEPPPTDANLEIIGADRARSHFDANNERLTGKGVTVGVIDTGIDYSHPDLKSNFKGGHDFVDSDRDPMETKGTNGLGTIHGTHVAGIIAANGKIKGVAPEAEIIAYRALGPGGSGTTEQVIAAIDQAIKDKVDILNLSLGNSVNGPDLPISLALNKAVEHGITAVTSSGNSGPNRWTVGSPGTAAKAISVGASTPPQQIPYLQINGNETIRMEPMQGSVRWNSAIAEKIIFGGLGKPDELQAAHPKGKIVLLERGKITFTQKAKNAAKAGAKAVIIFNNTNGSFIGNLEEPVPIPVMGISKQDGLKLRKIEPINARTILIEESDILADFSSRGPVTVTWDIKPDVVAPGVAINSTIPGGYLQLQGTSMAAPHVAGACALIKQAHPDWSPEQIKAALMNTAKPIKSQQGTPYKTYEQGAGRIQPLEAIKAETLVIPSSLQFGKFKLAEQHHQHSAIMTIKNISLSKRDYYFTIPKRTQGIDWELPLSFSLKPNEEKQVTVRMTIQPEHFKKKIHDGYLELNEGEHKIRIPYLYVLEEPDYPRVMGFELGAGDKEQTYRYEVYLPGGADEFGIALFEPGSHHFVGFLDWERNVGNGALEKEISGEKLPEAGVYIAKVFAKKGGKEDMIEAVVEIMSKKQDKS